jgi:hypothetical protein
VNTKSEGFAVEPSRFDSVDRERYHPIARRSSQSLDFYLEYATV